LVATQGIEIFLKILGENPHLLLSKEICNTS
jgi:hypothetical protein